MLKTVSTQLALASDTLSEILAKDNTSGPYNIAMDSGYGIDFSATPGTGTSELLDDYEEGTFTVELLGVGGTAIVYTPGAGDYGKYTKIGDQVFLNIAVTGTWTGGPASYYRIYTLPFTPSANSHSSVAIYNNSTGLFVDAGGGTIRPSEAYILTFATLTSGNALYMSANYFV
jgi:hypothetical protein